jgi:hypothetical protein
VSNFGSTAKLIIAGIAPTVGLALGGPFGGMAGSMLAKALGTTDEKSTEAAILAQNPDDLAKVKQAELDLQAKLAELGIEKESLAFADTDSARKREEVVKDSTPRILAYGITVGFFGILAYLLANGKPPDSDVIMVMLGALGTSWTGVIGYYFGSSAGSDNKAATIAKLAGGAQANAAAAAAK